MLPHFRRIPRKDFSVLRKPAYTAHTTLFSLRTYRRDDGKDTVRKNDRVFARAAVIVAKKEVKSAVKRNSIRRKYYHAIAPLLEQVDQCLDITIQTKKSSLITPQSDIRNELSKALRI